MLFARRFADKTRIEGDELAELLARAGPTSKCAALPWAQLKKAGINQRAATRPSGNDLAVFVPIVCHGGAALWCFGPRLKFADIGWRSAVSPLEQGR